MCPSGTENNNWGGCEKIEDKLKCDSWQYKLGSLCYDCGADCLTCEDESGECTKCNDGYVMDSANPTECIVQQDPKPEPVNPVNPVDPEQPGVCGDKMYSDSQGNCKKCGQGCLSCSDGSGKCNSCMTAREFGYYVPSTTN